MPLVIAKTTYRGWDNCWRMTNGLVELIAVADIGPRIALFRFVGGDNLFAELPKTEGVGAIADFRLYGGHRLWAAPETPEVTYEPDNDPAIVSHSGDRLLLKRAAVDPIRLERELEIEMHPEKAEVTVRHRIVNRGERPVRLAPWAVTMMAPGSLATVPRRAAPGGNAWVPDTAVHYWPGTDWSDPRIRFEAERVHMQHRADIPGSCKIGLATNAGWAGSERNGIRFLKRFDVDDSAAYPDGGCTVEVYTDPGFLELETLGPLRELAPSEGSDHVERWSLSRIADASGGSGEATRDMS